MKFPLQCFSVLFNRLSLTKFSYLHCAHVLQLNQSSQGINALMKSESDALLRAGRVVGYTPRGLLVDVSVKESCQQCAQGRGCGMGVLARQQHQRIEVKTPYASQLCEHYPLGTSVTLTLGRSDITLLALLVYALPLLVALLLSGGVAALGGAEWWAPASFFMTLFIGCVILKKLLSGRTERFRPQLVS